MISHGLDPHEARETFDLTLYGAVPRVERRGIGCREPAAAFHPLETLRLSLGNDRTGGRYRRSMAAARAAAAA
jgi:hypothetical protein